MKIGIDVRAACDKKKAGKGWYTYHVVSNLLKMDRKNEYVLYANSDQIPFEKYANVQWKIFKKNPLVWHRAVAKDFMRGQEHSVRTNPSPARRGCETERKSGFASLSEVELYKKVFFAPTSYIIPALLPPTVKSVMTVHDTVAFLFPLRHQTKAVIIEKLFLKKALKKTAKILAPSGNTKRDIEKLFYISSEKISVTPLSASEIFFKEPRGLKEFREKWNLPEKFILAVGTLEPRKNLPLLFSAVSSLFSSVPSPRPAVHELFMKSHEGGVAAKDWRGISLVVVGREGWKSKEIFSTMKKLGHRVIFLPYLPEEDLAKIYRLATVFVFPSLYEGFGIPPLEAMASGCPVICSNAASLPEVVGDAAMAFDPKDAPLLSAHLDRVLKNPNLREELIRRGKEQAQKFSWKKTAEKTFDALTGH